MEILFKVFFVLGIIIAILIFAYVLMFMFGTKTRSKMLNRQIRSLRGGVGMSKEDLESMMSVLGEVSINSRKKILNEHKDELKEMRDIEAEINKDAIKETSKAIKEGFTSSSSLYCKYCGKDIDEDSVFCKSCGKKVK